MKLINPTFAHESLLREYIDSMQSNNDSCHGCGYLETFENYQDWLLFLVSISDRHHLPQDSKFVEGSQYFLYDEENNLVIGMVNLRHYLNDYLLKYAGHIGYSIRPDHRGKGFAKIQLKLALRKLKEKGVSKALVCCDEDNLSSIKTVLSCGGIEDTFSLTEDSKIIRRFWINTI